MYLTCPQRESLRRVYSRYAAPTNTPLTYLAFRRHHTYPLICGDGAIMANRGDIYIGIETDGYSHS